MPIKTLTSYIRSIDDEKLNKLFEYVIAEMNRRKAKKQNVDAGFWNSDGVYIEDIQKIDKSEHFQSLNNEEIKYLSNMISKCESLSFLVQNKSPKASEIYLQKKKEYENQLKKLKAADLKSQTTSKSANAEPIPECNQYEKLKELDEDGFFDDEQEDKK